MALRAIEEVEGVDLPSQLIRVGLAAVSSRSLVWVASAGGGVVWTFAVMHPEPLRLVAAVGYCLTLLLPILWRDSRGG